MTTEIFEVVQPGLLTTVQDRGRYGCQQYGVPVAGAMDNYALRVGNLLSGNDEGGAALEITVVGPQLRLLNDTVVAITGADLSPKLNNNSLPMWQAVSVSRGDIISFGQLKNGCRSYLAVAGGIDVPVVMGSKSTDIRSHIGGFNGRALCAGDRLKGSKAKYVIHKGRLPPQYIPEYLEQSELRVILGPQDDYFTETGINTFLGSEYIISRHADRMGYRLQGPLVEHKSGADIISDGIPLGAVQVAADGLPIILLADRQTTGGYTKIAVVITADIPKLAQAKPGDRLRFLPVTEEQAHQALQKYEATIQSVRSWIQQNH